MGSAMGCGRRVEVIEVVGDAGGVGRGTAAAAADRVEEDRLTRDTRLSRAW